MTRIYQKIPLSSQREIILDEQASHHLSRVLRVQTGDEIIVFNGEGGEYSATITQISKKNVAVRINEFNAREVESPIRIHLAQGIARGEKMDMVVQKAVELGVSAITPLNTSRCNVRVDEKREEKRHRHWEAVIAGACEQSGRNRLPALFRTADLREWLSSVKADFRFILSPHADKKMSHVVIPHDSAIVLLIGPEGGFTEEEVDFALKNGFLPISLGPRILRTETAAIAAIAALQACYGDFFN